MRTGNRCFATRLGMVVLADLLARTGYACPAPVFVLPQTSYDLGDVPTGLPALLSIKARATSVNWGPGVRFNVSGTGPVQVTSSDAAGFQAGTGNAFQFDLNLTPSTPGRQSARLQLAAICNPSSTGNVEIVTLTYNGLTATGQPAVRATFASNPFSGFLGDPVATATGELFGFDEKPDLALGGSLAVTFTRYYATLLKNTGVTSALGGNWMHNFDTRLVAGDNDVTITLFRAKTVRFTRGASGWQLAGRERLNYQLATQGGDYRFLDPATNLIHTFSGSGALNRIEDRNGNALTVTQAAGGVGPAQVADGLGRILRFTYDGAKLTRVEDQTGRGVTFEYLGELLVAATDADLKRRSYNYTSVGTFTALLTEEIRPLGNKPYAQEFDAQGRVTRQLDSRGNATQLIYQVTPGASAFVDPLGGSVTHTHDVDRNLARIQDAAGQSTTFTYDASGRPTTRGNRLGDRAAVTYHEPGGRPASLTDEQGNTTTFAYAAQTQGPFVFQNLTRTGLADGAAVTFTHDNAGNILTLTDQAGKQWTATYSPRGQLETLTNPAGGVTAYSYSSDGTLASLRTDSGDTTTFTYDSNKRLSERKHPDETTRRYRYDNRDHLLRITDERGNATGFSHDDNGNRRSRADALNAVTLFGWNTDDRLATVTDGANKLTRFSYDAAGRLESVINQVGNKTSFAYDLVHRLTSAVDTAGKGNSFAYDREGRLTALTDALGSLWRFSRDPRGRLTRVTTPQEETATTAYDRMGRLVSLTTPAGETSRFSYDTRGLLTGIEAPAGLSAAFTRNDLGLVTGVRDPNGNVWTRDYDRMGRLTSAADPLSRATRYVYDNRQRVARVALPGGEVQFTHDATGNLTRARYSDGTDLNFVYDGNHRLVSGPGLSLGYDNNGRIIASNGLRIDRDDAGRIAAIIYPGARAVRYTYDARGLLARLVEWTGGTTEFAWTDARQISSIALPNGVRQEFAYDRNGRVSTIAVRRGGFQIASIRVRRDDAGRVISADRTSADSTAPPLPDVPNGTLPLLYDAALQVAGFNYDDGGRLVADSLRAYSWDLAGRLRSVAGADLSANFQYDGLGQRIARTQGGVTRNYTVNYALGRPSVAAVRSGGLEERLYIHLPDGTLLMSIDAAGSVRRFYHYDENGSTMLLTGDGGTVTDTYGITPYGETITRTGTTENPFTFLGAYGVLEEGDAGLYYMRARYYDSATARFLSRDPVTSIDPLAINPYQYARANPLRYADPSGREAGFDALFQPDDGAAADGLASPPADRYDLENFTVGLLSADTALPAGFLLREFAGTTDLECGDRNATANLLASASFLRDPGRALAGCDSPDSGENIRPRLEGFPAAAALQWFSRCADGRTVFRPRAEHCILSAAPRW